MTSATDQYRMEAYRKDLRRRRADALAAAVIGELRNFGHSESGYEEKDVYRAMINVLCREGAYVMTDLDREKMGLPMRGPDGWTKEEILAYERRLITALREPPSALVVERPPS